MASEIARKIVILTTFRLTTIEGPVEFKNIQLYLYEKVDEMIFGLPFTDVVNFDISSNSARNHE